MVINVLMLMVAVMVGGYLNWERKLYEKLVDSMDKGQERNKLLHKLVIMRGALTVYYALLSLVLAVSIFMIFKNVTH